MTSTPRMSSPCGPVRRARLAAHDIHEYLKAIESTGEIIPADALALTHRMTELGAHVDRVTELARPMGPTAEE